MTTDKAAMSFDTVNLSASRKNMADRISEKIGVENITAIASPNGAFRTAWYVVYIIAPLINPCEMIMIYSHLPDTLAFSGFVVSNLWYLESNVLTSDVSYFRFLKDELSYLGIELRPQIIIPKKHA